VGSKTIVVGVDKPGARLSFSSCMEDSNQNHMFHFCLSVTWTRSCRLSKDNPFGVKSLIRTPATSTLNWTQRKTAMKNNN
ncbi:hypothetical protein RYX36_026965, partial [Vicia faba]